LSLINFKVYVLDNNFWSFHIGSKQAIPAP